MQNFSSIGLDLVKGTHPVEYIEIHHVYNVHCEMGAAFAHSIQFVNKYSLKCVYIIMSVMKKNSMKIGSLDAKLFHFKDRVQR